MSSYTDLIKDGKVANFGEWALKCARQMGPLAGLKDEGLDAPLPRTFELSSYNLDRIQGAKNAVAEMEALSADEALKHAQEEHDQSVAYVRRQRLDCEQSTACFQAMLAEVLLWKAPSTDHEPLKDFMKKSLESEIQWLSELKVSDQKLAELENETVSGEAWQAERLASLKSDLERYRKGYKADQERALFSTRWLQQLRGSLHKA